MNSDLGLVNRSLRGEPVRLGDASAVENEPSSALVLLGDLPEPRDFFSSELNSLDNLAARSGETSREGVELFLLCLFSND